MTEPVEVVVVGGGVAGLTAAIGSAVGGARVTLCERSGRLGGRAVSRNHDGFVFNVGVHAVYTGGAFSRLLSDLDIGYGYGTPTDVSGLDDGRLERLPTTPWRLLRTRRFTLAQKVALVRFFAAVRMANPTELGDVSVEDFVATRVSEASVARFLRALAMPLVYSRALDLVSADVFVDRLARGLSHPVHYVDGGWQTIVDQLAARADAEGVDVRTAAPVVDLVTRRGRVVGVRLRDGQDRPSAVVVLATPPAVAAGLLDRAGLAAPGARVRELTGARVASLDVALSALPRPESPVVQDLGSPRFLTTQSRYASVAPAGGAVVSTFLQLDPRHTGDPRSHRAELEGLLDAAQPGWRERVVRQQYLPDIEACGALPLAATGGMRGRPPVDLAVGSGVLLAGDWVGAEGYLADAAAASGVTAARLATAWRTPIRPLAGMTSRVS
jgi:phytoene dehydrogenase-like protein